MVKLTSTFLVYSLLALFKFFFIIDGLFVLQKQITPDIQFAVFINFCPKIALCTLAGF